MEQKFELIAKTFQGLEDVLAEELRELGAEDVKPGRRMVSFRGDKAMMYRANFCLRCALRVLKPIAHFKARSADQVYDAVKNIEWTQYLNLKSTFSVDAVVYSEEFRHSKFVAYKVKDAIVDYFREKTGERLNISLTRPDLKLNIHISDEDCTLSFDSSGESLHLRGYRVASVEAPINEVLAAGLVRLSGWKADCDFIDPMCGSGTLAIEAALMARNIYPGLFRKEFAFERWEDFDKDLLDEIYNDDSEERPFDHKVFAYDINPQAILSARANIKNAGVEQTVVLEQRDFRQFTQPEERAIIVMNPPYGERIASPDILSLYNMIGERLKHQFVGGEAWIISCREECFDQIGLKPSFKIPLFNGSLDCNFNKYQIFGGKLKHFREEGHSVQTAEERKQMSDSRRFKENREFRRRSEDEETDGGTEIPSYILRKHRDFVESQERKERRERRDATRERRQDFHGSGENRGPRRDDRRPFRGTDSSSRFGRPPFRGSERREDDERLPFRRTDSSSRFGRPPFRGGERREDDERRPFRGTDSSSRFGRKPFRSGERGDRRGRASYDHKKNRDNEDR